MAAGRFSRHGRIHEPLGSGKERIGQRMVLREVMSAWHSRQRRIHQRVETSSPIHHKKRASILSVLETPQWQEMITW